MFSSKLLNQFHSLLKLHSILLEPNTHIQLMLRQFFRIALDHGYNLTHHQSFCGVIHILLDRVMVGKVGIHPHSHMTLSIHAHQVLLDGEVPYLQVQLPEPQQAHFKHVEVLRERNIGDITQSNRDMLDVCLPMMNPPTELLISFRMIVDSINSIGACESVLKTSIVVLFLVLTGEY
jgi:hypothetical protein